MKSKMLTWSDSLCLCVCKQELRERVCVCTTYGFNYRSAIESRAQTFLNRKESKSASVPPYAPRSPARLVLISKLRPRLAVFFSFFFGDILRE